MALITSRTRLSDLASLGASARKIVNERAVSGAEAARESESDFQQRANDKIKEGVLKKTTLQQDAREKGLSTSTTDLKSLKY